MFSWSKPGLEFSAWDSLLQSLYSEIFMKWIISLGIFWASWGISYKTTKLPFTALPQVPHLRNWPVMLHHVHAYVRAANDVHASPTWDNNRVNASTHGSPPHIWTLGIIVTVAWFWSFLATDGRYRCVDFQISIIYNIISTYIYDIHTYIDIWWYMQIKNNECICIDDCTVNQPPKLFWTAPMV